MERDLNKEEKGTEPPFTGEYYNHFEEGVYVCRKCNTPLYVSEDKFKADCGWPSFDQEVKGAVKRVPDKDGLRTEIICAKCGAYLGHVFEGENYTSKNVRHCVNSLSLKFIPAMPETAVFGGGCFWCLEAIFSKLRGVEKVVSGFAGGNKENPSYGEVSSGKTGHSEAIKIGYDSKVISYSALLDVFFHVHNPTTLNQQGNDVGEQYRSIILYTSQKQKEEAESFIKKVQKEFSDPIVTEVKPLEKFYSAEDCHQQYYERNPKQSYCQVVISPKLKEFYEGHRGLLK